MRRKGERTVYFDGARADADARSTSATGSISARTRGPAIVEQFDATTVIPPGWRATVDGFRNLILAKRERENGRHDPVTVQILRNKIASLVEEMHYHFYRSGYSTIIRESRDFSCVILDRDGRLIVAPPMFFHAPVYRHLVGRILARLRRRRDNGIATATCSSPTIPTRAACRTCPTWRSSRRCSPMARSSPSRARSRTRPIVGGTVAGSTSANATEMYHEGLLIPPIKIWTRAAPLPDIERLILDQQPPAGAGARRHAGADRRHRKWAPRASRNCARGSAPDR